MIRAVAVSVVIIAASYVGSALHGLHEAECTVVYKPARLPLEKPLGIKRY